MAIEEQKVACTGPAGLLEGVLRAPESGDPGAIVVICHPHPQHGGTMNNKVVTTLARAGVDLGWLSLRFNYRGVGASAGNYGEFSGECDDLRAVLGWVRDRYPRLPLHLAGFSFGSGVASTIAAEQGELSSLTLVAPPVEKYDFQVRSRTFPCPVFVVQGDRDELIDGEAVRRWCTGVQPTPDLLWFDGADHFFHGRLVELRERVSACWRSLV